MHTQAAPHSPPAAPTADAERAEHGDVIHEGQQKNLARGFVDAVRSRRGMPVERRLVAHADKQRTLSRKR